MAVQLLEQVQAAFQPAAVHPTRYILAAYGWDPESYAKRVRAVKDRGIRRQAEAELDSLRRIVGALESPGDILAAYLPDHHGKYVVLVPDYEALQGYRGISEDWFGRIDREAHIYTALSGDLSDVIRGFQNDTSDHLKLFFCVNASCRDALAEGISGVILLHSAASPLSDRQLTEVRQAEKQIPVIVDMVHLLGDQPGTILQGRSHDDAGHCEVIDLVAACRKQAEQLEHTLASSWERYYSAALTYFRTRHSLTPPGDYVTEDGVELGAWLVQLRTARKVGMEDPDLTPEHIARLDAIGMVWDVNDFVFERNYHSAAAYYRQHGDLECTADYVDESGVRLGAWLQYLRSRYKRSGKSLLTQEQFRMLDAIGMRWKNKYDSQWDMYFQVLQAYIRRTGNTDVPTTWNEGNVPLGRWYRHQKELFSEGKLRQDRVERLRSLELSLTVENPWEAKFRLAKAYSDAHGGRLNVPYDLVVNGVWLNKWLCEQRLLGEGKRKKKLTEEQRRKLESIGMVFGETSNDQSWEAHFQAVRHYVERTGSTVLPKDLRDEGANLRLWVKRQLDAARKGMLSAVKAEKLSRLGFVLDQHDSFENGLAHARAYFEQFGNLIVRAEHRCSDGFPLSAWLAKIRARKKKLSPEQIESLDAIGMLWCAADLAWDEMFAFAGQYAVAGEPLRIPPHQRAANGKDLYEWYLRQRRLYAAGKLSDVKWEKLLSIGAEMEPYFRRSSGETAGSDAAPARASKSV